MGRGFVLNVTQLRTINSFFMTDKPLLMVHSVTHHQLIKLNKDEHIELNINRIILN